MIALKINKDENILRMMLQEQQCNDKKEKSNSCLRELTENLGIFLRFCLLDLKLQAD